MPSPNPQLSFRRTLHMRTHRDFFKLAGYTNLNLNQAMVAAALAAAQNLREVIPRPEQIGSSCIAHDDDDDDDPDAAHTAAASERVFAHNTVPHGS